MSRPALEEQRFELIKSAIIDPDHTPLPDYLQESLERTIQASKLLDKNPVQRHAVEALRKKYPGLSRSQAYEDCRRAIRIFNSLRTFDFDWWQYWLLQDIAKMIKKAKKEDDLNAWAIGHKNLIKALGERPEGDIDPKLIEKNPIIIAVQVNNKTVNIDYEKFLSMPAEARKVITDSLNQEISIDDAEEIMNS